MPPTPEEFGQIWGSFPVYDDIARLEYNRRFWRDPEMRERLLGHWLDERHPYRRRFVAQRDLIESVLHYSGSDAELDQSLRQRNTSLRCVTREIPPVFGQFWDESNCPRASLRTTCENWRDS